MAEAANFNFGHSAFVDAIGVFAIGSTTFQPNLVCISRIVDTLQQFFESKMVAAAIVNYGHCAFFRHNICFYSIKFTAFPSNLVSFVK